VSNTETTTDDLWHAAVNGNGQYFSAGSPQALNDGLNTALSSISAKVGAGAAAATSTLNPVAGDNYAYVASYVTADWWGNLEQRSVNTTTGAVSETANWCVEDITADVCTSPSTVVTSTVGGSTQKSCVTSGATATSCVSPGVFDSSASTCSVPMAVACNGTLSSKVAATSDTRSIKVINGGALVDFTPANVNLAYFNASLLSQYTSLSSAQQANSTSSNMVNYLRGQTGYEMSGANAVNNQVFRQRQATLGDAIESTPTYIKKPVYSYADAGYSAFVTAQSTRAGAVYLGTNEGMLHSFDAATGVENWAFVPTPVIPNMYKLADKNYANLHNYYVNGDITIGDICTANCTLSTATWKTILVGGLHGGGKGYYAFDITNPASPSLLWEYTSASNANLGYSFGKPIITKKTDGTWVVLLTTGYNNVGDGVGRLLILNAATGAAISSISTAVGSTTTPSGLAQINDFVSSLSTNNTAGYVYGGDLLGNLWRFDINAGTVMLFAQLLDTSSSAQPITVAPELANLNNVRMVYIGTGKYLEGSDLSNIQVQTLYAISDPEATATLVNPRTVLTQQTFTNVSGTAYRTVSNNTVSSSSRGWYINLPDVGERQNVASQLISGTLVAPTNVPTNTACSPGGYGYVNYVNYQTGGAVLYNNPNYYASTKTNSMIVGLNAMWLGTSFTPVLNVVTADNPTPQLFNVPFTTSSAGYQSKRVIWRELIN
jgi:type IV pilus assembly protein PilY1